MPDKTPQLDKGGSTQNTVSSKQVLRADDLAFQIQKTDAQTTIYPASAIQKDLWIHWQSNPSGYAYNTIFSIKINSSINQYALEKFFQLFIDRHRALKSRFIQKGGGLFQETYYQKITLIVEDVVQCSEQEIQKRAKQLHQTPIHLEKDPLFRVCLLTKSENEHYLVVIAHHSVCDTWSISIMLKELIAAYPSIRDDLPVVLPAVTHQYQDFCHWQSSFLNSEEGKIQLEHWKDSLPNEAPILTWSFVEKKTKTSSLKTHSFRFSSAKLYQIKEVCSRYHITPNIFFFSIFQLLLHRYSAENTILTGTPMTGRLRTTHGRKRKDFFNTPGCFVNMTLIHTLFSEAQSFMDLARQIHDRYQEGFKYQDLPFSLVKSHCGLSSSSQIIPQTGFVFQKNTDPDIDVSMVLFPVNKKKRVKLGEFSASPFYIPQQAGDFELLWELLETDDRALANLKYQTNCFDRATITRLARHLENLVNQVIQNPELSISEFDIVTPEEKQQILHEWNNTGTPYPKDKTIVDLFEEQSQKYPDKTAVVFEEQQLTYSELNQKANQLAHLLKEKGVKPETIVGLMMPRSLEMIIGIMGVLKAGGAYLPIDPEFPDERIEFMLKDATISTLVTYRCEKTKNVHVPNLVDLGVSDTLANQSNGNLTVNLTPNNLAYVIYTSGSTGKPKGVLIQHSGVTNLVSAQKKEFQLTSEDRILQFANLSFDASAWEIFMALSMGASLYIPSKEKIENTTLFEKFLEEGQLTIATLPPSYLSLLNPSKNTHLRIVVSAGSALPKSQIKAWSSKLNLINAYGPTEFTVCVTMWKVDKKHLQKVPIGKPIKNTKIFILDSFNNLLPIGVKGELCISGPGLARGYLNRPDLTQEKFIDHPFVPEEKLYKTGDIASWLPDGNVLFHGRNDDQVKVRGFRIELGEIESVLQQHSLVQESAVIAKGEALVAFVTLKQNQSSIQKELLTYLESKLPHYMAPSSLIVLDQFQFNSSGKIDRKYLADYEQKQESKNAFIGKTKLEKDIIKIWQKVLGLKQTLLSDDFFSLGGNSLLSIEFALNLSKSLKKEVPNNFIYMHSTLKELIHAIQVGLSEKIFLPLKRGSFASLKKDPEASENRLSATRNCTVQNKPLIESLKEIGITHLDSVALGYFPSILSNRFITRFSNNELFLFSVLNTHLGSIGIALLPLTEKQLYLKKKQTISEVIKAANFAKTLGAKTISLTGVIPSATDYGRHILTQLNQTPSKDGSFPKITTGHPTTVAGVVLATQKILGSVNREISQEIVGFLGLGAIGTASLRLMSAQKMLPKKIILCDVEARKDFLICLKEEIINRYHFAGEIALTYSKAAAPELFYESTLVIGATNVPDVLDVDRLSPGTIIVDDSGPHCFDVDKAFERVKSRADILFTEGGILVSPKPISEAIHIPSQFSKDIESIENPFLWRNEHEITGCVLSGLLSAVNSDVLPSIGITSEEEAQVHLALLRKIGFEASVFRCNGENIEVDLILKFKEKFGVKKLSVVL